MSEMNSTSNISSDNTAVCRRSGNKRGRMSKINRSLFIYKLFASNFKEWMKANNITVIDIASKIDVTRVSVYGWINGESIPMPCLYQSLCDVYKLDYDYFYRHNKS